MHLSKFNFKFIGIMSLVLFWAFSCKDIPRDNILDPKNPSSYRDWVISIEAFVNTENDELYNEYLIEALNYIAKRYPSNVTIAHYHRNAATYTDSLSIPENEYIYEDYLNLFDSQKGVPDVFINGSLVRVKGTSTPEGAIERIERAILPLMKENSHITIEPEVSEKGNKFSLNIKLARLGSTLLENIFIRIIVVEEIDAKHFSRVVRFVRSSNIIPTLEPGEVKEVKFDEIEFKPQAAQILIINVLSGDDLVVRQSVKVAMP